MSKLNIIGLILGICGGIAGMVVAIFAEASEGGFPVISVSISFIFIAIFGGVFWFFFRPMLQAQAVLKSGEPAEATILKLWDTGVSINDNPQVGLLLEVRPPGQAPFQAETKTVISRLQTSIVQPGMAVQVRYDPNDTSKVAIESFGGEQVSGLPAGAITVDGQAYASVDEMPPHVRQAYDQVLTAFKDTNGDGTPDILQGGAQVIDPRSQKTPANREQRLQELKGLLDADLITEQNYEARKAEILAEI